MTSSPSSSSQNPNFLASHAAPSWIGRVIRFSKQMFPLYPNVVVFVGQFVLNYSILQALFFQDAQWNLWHVIWGAISSVLFVYMFRVFDELKDYPTDLINFPDRPLVVGVMNIPDAHRLWITVVGVLFGIQFFISQSTVWWAFSVVMMYSFLAFRWFFLEDKIRPNLPLAMYTHNPILYLYQIYLLSFFVAPWSGSIFPAFWFLVGDTLVGTAWEISRKIRGIQQEDTYTTYSKVWGRGPSLSVVAVLLSGAGVLTATTLASATTQWLGLAWAPASAIWIQFVMNAIRFVKDPQRAPAFKVQVEYFKMSLLFAYLVVIVWKLM